MLLPETKHTIGEINHKIVKKWAKYFKDSNQRRVLRELTLVLHPSSLTVRRSHFVGIFVSPYCNFSDDRARIRITNQMGGELHYKFPKSEVS